MKQLITKKEHSDALLKVEELILLDPDTGTADASQIIDLSNLIEEYEANVFEFEEADPVETIEFVMEQNDLSQRDLVAYIGSKSKVSEILSRKRTLTLPMIRALTKGLDIPAEILIRKPKPNPGDERAFEFDTALILEIIKRKWVKGSKKDWEQHPETIISELLSPIGGETSLAGLMLRTSKHIRAARQMNDQALGLWIARILSIANQTESPEFDLSAINRTTFMGDIARISANQYGPLMAIEALLDVGIIVVVESHLPKTYLDGATLIRGKENPIIGLTLRFDRLDNFWFTLMHELAHLFWHSETGVSEFIDDLESPDGKNEIEREADSIAAESLIPSVSWDNSIVKDNKMPAAAKVLAQELGIHPSIVAGAVRKRFNYYKHAGMNKMVGPGLVRQLFPDVVWAG